MAAPTNKVGIAREQTVFAVLETVKGTLAFPAADAQIIVAAGYGEITQQPTTTNSEEIANTRDLLNIFTDQCPAGTFTLPIYLRPSGTKGSVPMGDVLLTSLMGKKTVTANTSVVYAPAMEKPAFSLWVKRSHTVFFARGAVVDSAKISATNKGGAKLELSGQLLQMGWAGRDGVAAIAAEGATTVVVYDAKKYCIGGRIYNKTQNDFATNGYEITDVDVATNTLTLGSGIAAATGWAVSDVIEGYLPAGTVVGTALESRKTHITIGGTAKNLISVDFTADDKVTVLEEISTSGYPNDYAEGDRSVKASVSAFFRQNDLDDFYDAFNDEENEVVITIGDTDGSICVIDGPRVRSNVPKVSASAPTLNSSFDLTFLGSGTGENSFTITFR